MMSEHSEKLLAKDKKALEVANHEHLVGGEHELYFAVEKLLPDKYISDIVKKAIMDNIVKHIKHSRRTILYQYLVKKVKNENK